MRVIDTLIVLFALVASCMGVCTFSGTDFMLSDVNGHYYRVMECINETWIGANAFAQSTVHPKKGNGYLMTINNYAEQRFITTRPLSAPSNVDIFVGGIDTAGSNKWYWAGPPGVQFFLNATGCQTYCNFDANFPLMPTFVPQGLRLRYNRKWVSGPIFEVVPRAFAFVEFGCCECGLRGTCDESTCDCSCSDNYIGDSCETYVGGCRYPDAPICDPITPICMKTTDTPTVPATAAPTVPPTVWATLPPTVPATLPPTVPPTVPATKAPTVPPTVPATLPPTVPATLPPTVPATKAPTVPATLPPTVAPPSPCRVSLSALVEPGYPQPLANGGSFGIVDIVALNVGTQVANRVLFDIVLPATAYTTTWWNFARLPPTYIDFWPALAPGANFSLAKFQMEDPANSALIVSFVYNSTLCS